MSGIDSNQEVETILAELEKRLRLEERLQRTLWTECSLQPVLCFELLIRQRRSLQYMYVYCLKFIDGTRPCAFLNPLFSLFLMSHSQRKLFLFSSLNRLQLICERTNTTDFLSSSHNSRFALLSTLPVDDPFKGLPVEK